MIGHPADSHMRVAELLLHYRLHICAVGHVLLSAAFLHIQRRNAADNAAFLDPLFLVEGVTTRRMIKQILMLRTLAYKSFPGSASRLVLSATRLE